MGDFLSCATSHSDARVNNNKKMSPRHTRMLWLYVCTILVYSAYVPHGEHGGCKGPVRIKYTNTYIWVDFGSVRVHTHTRI